MATEHSTPVRRYSFAVWPKEGGGRWESYTFDLFRMYPRVEMELTREQWVAFQAGMEREGFTLREVECEEVTRVNP